MRDGRCEGRGGGTGGSRLLKKQIIIKKGIELLEELPIIGGLLH